MLLLLERRPLRIAAHAFLPRFRAAAGQSCWPEHLLCIGARVYACRTKTFSALALYQGTRLRVPHKNRTCFVSGHAFTRAVQKPFSALALYQGTRLRVPHKNLFRTCFVSGHAFTRAVSAFNGLGLQPLKLKRRYSLRTFCCSWKKASQRVVIPR